MELLNIFLIFIIIEEGLGVNSYNNVTTTPFPLMNSSHPVTVLASPSGNSSTIGSKKCKMLKECLFYKQSLGKGDHSMHSTTNNRDIHTSKSFNYIYSRLNSSLLGQKLHPKRYKPIRLTGSSFKVIGNPAFGWDWFEGLFGRSKLTHTSKNIQMKSMQKRVQQNNRDIKGFVGIKGKNLYSNKKGMIRPTANEKKIYFNNSAPHRDEKMQITSNRVRCTQTHDCVQNKERNRGDEKKHIIKRNAAKDEKVVDVPHTDGIKVINISIGDDNTQTKSSCDKKNKKCKKGKAKKKKGKAKKKKGKAKKKKSKAKKSKKKRKSRDVGVTKMSKIFRKDARRESRSPKKGKKKKKKKKKNKSDGKKKLQLTEDNYNLISEATGGNGIKVINIKIGDGNVQVSESGSSHKSKVHAKHKKGKKKGKGVSKKKKGKKGGGKKKKGGKKVSKKKKGGAKKKKGGKKSKGSSKKKKGGKKSKGGSKKKKKGKKNKKDKKKKDKKKKNKKGKKKKDKKQSKGKGKGKKSNTKGKKGKNHKKDKREGPFSFAEAHSAVSGRMIQTRGSAKSKF